MKKVFGKVSLLAAVLMVILMASGCAGTKKVKLNDYLQYEVVGYNGYAYVSSDLDMRRLEEDLSKMMDSDQGLGAFDALYSVEKNVKGEWKQQDYLSNGDTIEFVWDVDPDLLKKDYKIVFDCSNLKEKVSGLPEAQKKDVFSEIEVVYSGISPNVHASISSDTYSANFFKITPETGISNGDTITVSFSDNHDEKIWAMNYGIIPEKDSKTFQVEGTDKYIERVDEIPEDTMKTVLGEIDKYLEGWDETTSYKILSYYMLKLKNDDQSNMLVPHNILYVVFRADWHNSEDGVNEDVTQYMYYKLENLILCGDGTVSVDFNSAKYSEGSSFLGDLRGEYFKTSSGKAYHGYDTEAKLISTVIDANREQYEIDSKKAEESVQ